MSSTAALTNHIANLGINDPDEKHNGVSTHVNSDSISSSTQMSLQMQSQHSRVASTSSASSALYSDSSSAPGRPRRSPMRKDRRGGDMTALLLDVDNLRVQVTALLDKIYEIEELRHSPSSGSSHASRLDGLLSELDSSIASLAPRMEAYDASAPAYPNDILSSLRADWAKVLAQDALLKQELLEDPWLIRFRVTADQAEGMMDPLQTSLQDVTTYVGRILSSFTPVPMHAPEGRLSIARLQDMADGHRRLRATYVSSVNKILRIMDKSVAERAIKNGEALRRVNDLASRWRTLQKQLSQLDDKVSFVLRQNDPDNPNFEESMEMLDDDEVFARSPPYSPQTPQNGDVASPIALHRVVSAESGHSSTRVSPRTSMYSSTNGSRATASTSGSHSLAPPPMPRLGSTTPNAGRTLRRQLSRSSMASNSDRPRWNISTKADPVPATPPMPRRPSHNGSVSGYTTPHRARAQSPALSSPPGGSASRIPRGTPRKSMPSTPGRAFTPAGSRSGRPSMPAQSRPSFGAAHGRPPPSSYRAMSPVSTPGVHRPSSAMSVGSIGSAQIAALDLRLFQPSKYDQLDLEVQKVIDAVQPNIFIARLDQPMRRGQRRADGETWTGEFVFGVGERSTSVKLLELASRSGNDATKRRKVMVRIGGAWQDLTSHLRKKRDEAASMDQDVF